MNDQQGRDPGSIRTEANIAVGLAAVAVVVLALWGMIDLCLMMRGWLAG